MDDADGTLEQVHSMGEEAGRNIHTERVSTMARGKAELVRLRNQRRSKEVKLNRLSSISGGGGSGVGIRSDRDSYHCGGKGRGRRDSPRRRK